MTAELAAIVAASVGEDEILKVCAVAGSGKSMALREYAAARPCTPCLYLTFNKPAQVDQEVRHAGGHLSGPRVCRWSTASAAAALDLAAEALRDSMAHADLVRSADAGIVRACVGSASGVLARKPRSEDRLGFARRAGWCVCTSRPLADIW